MCHIVSITHQKLLEINDFLFHFPLNVPSAFHCTPLSYLLFVVFIDTKLNLSGCIMNTVHIQ